jgi:magnesium-transporting ATPase (P-type)
MTVRGASGGQPAGTGVNGGNAGSLKGLTGREVEELHEKFGFNDIPEEKRHPLLKFFGYFWGPLPWIIEVAAVLSAFIGHWEDFSVIVLLLIINAVVGFFQERKAENSIELLKGSYLLLDESALTGESLPVKKKGEKRHIQVLLSARGRWMQPSQGPGRRLSSERPPACSR